MKIKYDEEQEKLKREAEAEFKKSEEEEQGEKPEEVKKQQQKQKQKKPQKGKKQVKDEEVDENDIKKDQEKLKKEQEAHYEYTQQAAHYWPMCQGMDAGHDIKTCVALCFYFVLSSSSIRGHAGCQPSHDHARHG